MTQPTKAWAPNFPKPLPELWCYEVTFAPELREWYSSTGRFMPAKAVIAECKRQMLRFHPDKQDGASADEQLLATQAFMEVHDLLTLMRELEAAFPDQ